MDEQARELRKKECVNATHEIFQELGMTAQEIIATSGSIFMTYITSLYSNEMEVKYLLDSLYETYTIVMRSENEPG
jgi:hypothetical protein